MANDIFVNNADVGRASSQDGTKMVEIVFLVGIYYFLFKFYVRSRLFHSFWAESNVNWGKTRRSPRKNIWPPVSKTCLVLHVTRARLNLHSDEITGDLER